MIIVPVTASEEGYRSAVPNLRALIDSDFPEENSAAAEIGIRRSDAVCVIDISVRGIPNEKDGLSRILSTVVAAFGHTLCGEIECADSGSVHDQLVFN